MKRTQPTRYASLIAAALFVAYGIVCAISGDYSEAVLSLILAISIVVIAKMDRRIRGDWELLSRYWDLIRLLTQDNTLTIEYGGGKVRKWRLVGGAETDEAVESIIGSRKLQRLKKGPPKHRAVRLSSTVHGARNRGSAHERTPLLGREAIRLYLARPDLLLFRPR